MSYFDDQEDFEHHMATRRRRSDVGRRSKELGDSFELWCATQHEKAMHLGILAHVEKTQAKARVIEGRLRYEKKGIADYIGCLEPQDAIDGKCSDDCTATAHRIGRYLAVEAKSTGKDYLPRAEITDLQQAHLDAVAHAGGLALLLVHYRIAHAYSSFPSLSTVAIPWLSVPWKVKKSAESVAAEDVIEWRVAEPCYLSRWHAGGPRSSTSGGARSRKYARE